MYVVLFILKKDVYVLSSPLKSSLYKNLYAESLCEF